LADAGALTGAVAAFFHLLPNLTALLAAVWIVLRIGVAWQEWILNRRKLNASRLIAVADETHEGVRP
jgi:uncharacterized protein YqgC (DUF456 family)